jgi:hypothetical protein
MAIINAFGVAAAGASWPFHASAAAAAHPAFMGYARAAAITPQRKRRTTAATGPSVNRGPD